MKNFPDIKDDQRFILEAEELFFSEREVSGKKQRTGQGRNSACHKASCHPAEVWTRGVFLGTEALCCHVKEKREKKSHF